MRRWRAEPGSELASLRIACHRLLDSQGEFGGKTRSAAYADLAAKMNMPVSECHFGMFTEEQCRRALVILQTK